jgi:cell wall-associated NlpC family hydrolase
MKTLKYEHLIGTTYEQGSTDCFGICRSFFKDNFNIEITDYSRPTDWWDHGLNLYMDNFYTEGFRLIDIPLREVRPADVFLISIRSNVPNHAAIALYENNILHHPYNRLSCVEQYKGVWRNYTVGILRHKGVPDLREEMDTVDLLSLLPEHIRRNLNEETAEVLQ